MTNPAEDVPADRPTWWGNRQFLFGTLRLGVPGAERIGAMVEPADQLDGAFKSMQAAIPMIANVHRPTARRTGPVNDVEFPEGEIRIRRPIVRHPADLHVLVGSIAGEGTTEAYTRKPSASSSLA